MATVTGGGAAAAPQLRDQVPKKPCRATEAAVKFVLDLREGCGAIAKAINAPWSLVNVVITKSWRE